LSQQGKTAGVQAEAGQASAISEHRTRIERLFREHHDDLVRFLRARFPVHDAREAAAEAFAKLLRLDSSAVRHLRAFLFTSAANIAIDARRRDGVLGRARADLPLILFSDTVDTRTPERRTTGEQQLQRLQRVIEAMPPKCKTAFVMHQIEGMDYPQIAAEMGLTESMVRKYVERGLLHCRACLDLETENEKR
jgi:RNA polymerase sigma factor (sigma-70 family)